MTSTCGGIRWGRAEGQYLFKLITSRCKACVYVHTYSCLVFIAHTCGKEDMWGSVIAYASLHMSVHRHGFYWYKHTRLWCDSAWASAWPPPSASMTSSAPNGLQLSLGVINIPAVEILACVGKHDKTATHLSAPSTACHLSEAHNQTSAGLRSFLTDHLSSRLPACHSHAQSPWFVFCFS